MVLVAMQCAPVLSKSIPSFPIGSYENEIMCSIRISSSSSNHVFDIGLVAVDRNESRVVILAGQEIEGTGSMQTKLSVK